MPGGWRLDRGAYPITVAGFRGLRSAPPRQLPTAECLLEAINVKSILIHGAGMKPAAVISAHADARACC